MAGVMAERFSARFVASMAVFNSSVAPSRLLGCWDLFFMVETRDSHERTVRRGGYEGDSWKGGTPRANRPIVATRIEFTLTVVALKGDACDRPVTHNIYHSYSPPLVQGTLNTLHSPAAGTTLCMHLVFLVIPSEAHSRNIFVTYPPPISCVRLSSNSQFLWTVYPNPFVAGNLLWRHGERGNLQVSSAT